MGDTLFYQDTRILTTIRDSNNDRLIGSQAPEPVIEDVLKQGVPKFYTNVLINGATYFSYYMPLFNSDGSTVGMLFVGKPSLAVRDAVQRSLFPLIGATIIAVLCMSVTLFFYTKGIVKVLLHIRMFLADVATGNLSAELDTSVSKRNDEFGDIGRSALSMQRSLRNLIEQDALTCLYNRRSGDRKLRQTIDNYRNKNTDYSIAIGDIDFFKKVNDTYGHDCGDLILKSVAHQLRQHMRENGFVARWGGEEFLLVFERMDLVKAHEILTEILDDIRAMESKYDDQIIKVTMTFGLTQGDGGSITQLLRLADEKLYTGKTGGRNRIIWDDPSSDPESPQPPADEESA